MSHTVLALCHPDVAAGFRLAGVPALDASNPTDAADRLREMHQADLGVILIQDSLYEKLPEELQHQFGKQPLPMLVPFPGPTWESHPESAEAYIVELLRQVVGYRVRLR
jgi:vacuolar-type H+-ATPase subunit F/Vma7